MKLWTHQERALSQVRAAYAAGNRRILCVAPPGAGKSLVMRELARAAVAKGGRVAIVLHRSMLLEQTIRWCDMDGIKYGVRAAGYKPEFDQPVQIAMSQTEAARAGKFTWDKFDASLVLIDEAHQQTGKQARLAIDSLKADGGCEIGFTATPVDCGCYETIVDVASYSELRQCGAHLPVHCYGPDQPDTSKLKRMKGGEYSTPEVSKLMRVPTIFGRVLDHWHKYNLGECPTILWAPGVDESKWFAKCFVDAGIPAGHIDATSVCLPRWHTVDGRRCLQMEEFQASSSARAELLEMSKSGDCRIVCNRFVLREAIDMPWIYHGILATVFGALSSYLQTVGRIQRYWPDYDHVLLQDHGGNYDRHGAPDQDRQWVLGDTNTSIASKTKKERQKTKGEEAEPICCPKCAAMRTHGPVCQQCGYRHQRSTRMVRQLDGELVRKVGRLTKYKRPKQADDYLRSALFAAYWSGQTVGQAVGIAKARMQTDGVGGSFESIRLPDRGSNDWNMSVRRVYPWAKPKGRK